MWITIEPGDGAKVQRFCLTAIFAKVCREKRAADDNPNLLRWSIDTQAKVKLGNRSRNGKARRLEAKKADDHDTEWQAVLVPLGMLNTHNDQRSMALGQSAETSDFRVACLTAWWRKHHLDYPHLDEWVIDLASGSATRSDRTQLSQRMVELAQTLQLSLRLIADPPDHSNYNPMERWWAALENDWHGAILDSLEAAGQWAANMTWKGVAPIVQRVEATDDKGVKVLAATLEQYRPCWQRSETLPTWAITIAPT